MLYLNIYICWDFVKGKLNKQKNHISHVLSDGVVNHI